jgi:hypothetical protein
VCLRLCVLAHAGDAPTHQPAATSFLPKVANVQPRGLGRVIAGVQIVAVRQIRFARRLLVLSRAVMRGRLSMVLCGVRKMLGRLSVMLNCFGRHLHASFGNVRS